MKQIIKLIALVFTINCFSQTPNPDLFQTWYLHDMYSTDDNIHYPVANITPPISPNVTFTNGSPLSLSGQGACNFFTGTFSNPFGDVLQFSDFAATLSLCGFSSHIAFEGGYFSLFQTGGQYIISGSGQNMTLVISTPIFTNYVFGNFPLNTAEFDLKQTTVYPNPTKSKVSVDSKNQVIQKIEILNALGQTVKTLTTDLKEVDLSDCASGIYIMKLYAEGSTASKNIIKH